MTLSNNTTISTAQARCTLKQTKQSIDTFRASSLTHRAVDNSNVSNSLSTHYSTRPYLYTSNKYKGSITLEAAIALPIFIFFFTTLLSVMNAMYIQLSLQIQLEETARTISKTVYNTYTTHLVLNDDKDDDTTYADLNLAILSIATIQNTFLDSDMKNFLDNSSVHKGSKGINFLSSNIDADKGFVDLVLTYSVKIPFVPKNIATINLSNRCYLHLYMGESLSKELESENTYVYCTVYGQVYHTNKYCQYLLNYSKATSFNQIDLAMYQTCLSCVDMDLSQLKSANPIVYTTDKGYAYHTSLECSTFTGSVYRLLYSALPKNKKICTQCFKGK